VSRRSGKDKSATSSSAFRGAIDALNAQISRLGRLGAAAYLTAITAVTMVALHNLVCRIEGLQVTPINALNLASEIIIVAGPIILYARDIIAKLNTSRAALDEMSRRLQVSVEQAEAANRAKSAFLANMSHELRTPLNAIMGFSEVMKDEHLGPMHNARYLSYAEDILASGRYLLGIINDILDLSKIEAGKMTVENAEEFPLCEALEGSLALCAPLGEKCGVSIESRLPPANLRILAVERMIRQIMINLVGNAIKFTPAGGKVVVGGARAADGGYVVTVQDSGIGMSEKDIAKALTPFGQVENRMTATQNGTGLGLPLAKAMLELHGGTLEITSRPGSGTKVALIFPASRIQTGRRVAA
jgi:signal transduction histidine kinase